MTDATLNGKVKAVEVALRDARKEADRAERAMAEIGEIAAAVGAEIKNSDYIDILMDGDLRERVAAFRLALHAIKVEFPEVKDDTESMKQALIEAGYVAWRCEGGR